MDILQISEKLLFDVIAVCAESYFNQLFLIPLFFFDPSIETIDDWQAKYTSAILIVCFQSYPTALFKLQLKIGFFMALLRKLAIWLAISSLYCWLVYWYFVPLFDVGWPKNCHIPKETLKLLCDLFLKGIGVILQNHETRLFLEELFSILPESGSFFGKAFSGHPNHAEIVQ